MLLPLPVLTREGRGMIDRAESDKVRLKRIYIYIYYIFIV